MIRHFANEVCKKVQPILCNHLAILSVSSKKCHFSPPNESRFLVTKPQCFENTRQLEACQEF